MSFAPLPGTYLTWDESAEPVAEFLRYQVYRREVGVATWTRLARITDRSITSYNDYTVASGTLYEYAVTQVKDVEGEEVESEFPTVAQARLTIRSIFVHDVRNPAHYIEILAQSMSETPEQDVTYLQPWAARAPVAHVGARYQHTVEADVTDVWEGSELWAGIKDLQRRQRDNGSLLMVRQYRDTRYFVAMETPQRSDTTVLFNARLRFREVEHSEEVA